MHRTINGIRFIMGSRDYHVPDATGGGNSKRKIRGFLTMPRRTSLIICVFPSLEHSTWCVHKLQTILGLLCVPLVGTQTTDGEMPSLCQTKHNRAKPMSELSSALFSIADDNEFGSRGYVLHSLVQFRYVICGCLAASICF